MRLILRCKREHRVTMKRRCHTRLSLVRRNVSWDEENFIQRETLNYAGCDLESYCFFLAEKFLTKYPQVEGVRGRVAGRPPNVFRNALVRPVQRRDLRAELR